MLVDSAIATAYEMPIRSVQLGQSDTGGRRLKVPASPRDLIECWARSLHLDLNTGKHRRT